MRRVVQVSFAALTLLLAAPAGAAPVVVTSAPVSGYWEGELALAGPATLLVGNTGGATNVVRSFSPGHAPAVVSSVTLRQGGGGHSLQFAASASRIAVLDKGSSGGYKGTRGVPFERQESGLLGGPLSALGGSCLRTSGLDHGAGGEEGPPDHSSVAVDGEVVAYDSFGCVIVEDFGSGLRRVIPLEATLDPFTLHHGLNPAEPIEYWLESGGWETRLRVAGRLVAYRSNSASVGGQASVVVYDVDAGRALYSVPLPPDVEYGESLIGPTFALQADGTLVVSDAQSCTATVSTIADSAPRPLGIAACAVRGLDDGRALIVTPTAHNQRLLAWTAMEGPAAQATMIHPIAALGRDGTLEATPAVLDETDVAYALGNCTGARVYRAALTEPGTPPPPPVRCPVSVSPRHATLTPRALSVRIRCPLGCEGGGSVNVGTLRQLRAGRSALGPELELAPFTVAPGQSKMFTLLPSLAGEYDNEITPRTILRLARRTPHLDLEVALTTDTPNATGICRSSCDGGSLGIVFTTHIRTIVPIELAHTGK